MSSRRLLWAILAVALVVRVWGLGFGLPAAMARPDETQIAGPAVGYLSGDFTPQFFQWPTFFSYVVAAAYALYAVVGRPFTGFTSIAAFAESRRQSLAPFLYISRGLSTLFGVATVWGVYAMGRRLFDETVGLVAALFLALAFLHVRDSHFGVTDVPMTALVVFAVLLVLRWHDAGGLWRAVAAGLVSGLAGSTKYNGLGTGVAFAAAWGFKAVDARRARDPRGWRLAAELGAYGLAMAVGFFGASPYILIQWDRFRMQTGWVAATLEQGHGIVLGRGWWYYAHTILPAAVGWPLFITGVAGMGLMLVTRPRRSTIALAFPLAYYALAGQGYAVFARYIIPVLPFLCLGAGWAIVWGSRRVAAGWSEPRRRALIAAAALAVVAPTAIKTVQIDRLLTAIDNRVVVARAVAGIVPPGSVFYQTGSSYGEMPLGMNGRELDLRPTTFDAQTGRFDPVEPDWVLVQRSPLRLYSGPPNGLMGVLDERYQLVRSFPTGGTPVEGRLYDQQDAFYLPLTKLGGLQRPGPEFDLYTKRRR